MLYFNAQAALEYSENDARKALVALDDSLERRMVFIKLRQLKIDSLTEKLKSRPNSHELLLKIADSYTAFNNDSALHYLQIGRNVATGNDKLPFVLKHFSLMPLSGAVAQAVQEFDSIDASLLPKSYLPMYFESGRQMYSYLSAFSGIDEKYRDTFKKKAIELQCRLLELLQEGTSDYKYHLGEYYFFNGEKGKSQVLLEEVFENGPISL